MTFAVARPIVFFGVVWTLASMAVAVAENQPGAAGTRHSIVHRAFDAGGGRLTSRRYEVVSSANAFGASAASASASIQVRPGFAGQLNEHPIASPDSFATRSDTPLILDVPGVLGNDFDPERAPLAAVLVTTPAHGTLILQSDGSLRYTPTSNFSSADSFSYRASDGAAESAPVFVNVEIVPVNNPPVNNPPAASPQSVVTAEDSPLPITLSGSDVEGSPLTFFITAPPVHGTLSGTPPALVFLPATDFNGSDAFAYRVNDGSLDSSSATISITVIPQNDPPRFTKGPNQSLPSGTTAGQSIPVWATAIDDGDSAMVQSLNFTVTENGNSGLFTVAPTVAPDGTLAYQLNGTAGSATLSVTLTDDSSAGGVPLTTEPQTFTIAVAAAPNYLITTTGNAIVVTDMAGNGDALTISQPIIGKIRFAATGRTFSVNGSAATTGNSGDLSLANVTSMTVNAGAGNDTLNVSAFTSPLPSLTLNGGLGNDTVNFNGSLTFAANANLDVNLQNDDTTPGVDKVTVAANAVLTLSGSGTATVKVSRNIVLNSGSQLLTVDGALTLEANQQVAPATGDFVASM